VTDFSISAPVAIFSGAALLLVGFIAKVVVALGRRRRLHVRHDEIRAARARERIMSSGPGIVVWATEDDAWRAWRAGTPQQQAIPRLAAHVEALHAKSGRLLATAEGAGCDAAFVESLARMDRHLAGLLAAVTRPR
jgi:hypothetical protein